MLALLLLAAAPAADGPDAAALAALLAEDVRVAAIGDRLARHGPCDGWLSNPGILIQDAAQYAESLRPAARAALGLADGPTIVAVLPGSEAAAAGLAPGDELRAVDGEPVPAAARGKSFTRIAATEKLVERGLADGGGVTLRVRRGAAEREIAVASRRGCASRFQLLPGRRLNASADGVYVQVSGALAEFAADDDELAVIIAHELAHNILGHKARLDAAGVSRGLLAGFGRNRTRIRATELEADRWALYLMARAGYRFDRAPAFWERFGRRADPGIFADGTHAGWRERVARAEAEIARIRAQQAAGTAPTP